MQTTPSKNFDWLGEVNKTVTHSLVTTFGLDFLFIEDKKGGDVDTVHNVRQNIYASESERERYNRQEKYSSGISKEYHTDKNYIQKGRQDKYLQENGNLIDRYTSKKIESGQKRQLDHVISAKEIHNDRGRRLAGIDGVGLANADSNLSSTAAYINNKKSDMPIERFVHELPGMIESKKQSISADKKKLEAMQEGTPQQRHEKTKLEDKIRKEQAQVSDLESIDKEAMLEADKKARKQYDQEISRTYYSSSKFFKNSAAAAVKQGAAMGARQAVGLVLAEIWFELKDAVPSIYKKNKDNFNFDSFWSDVKNTVTDILTRVKNSFKDALGTFKDSFIGGVLASITTTLLNIVFTSGKLLGKLIRESWNNLVQAMKLVFFNPQKLAFGDLMREVTRIILASVSTIIGVTLNQKLATILTIPFGTEIAAFISALCVGLLTVGTGYFLDHSRVMNKLWNFLNTLKDKYTVTLDFMREANAEINQYATQLARLEFNLNTNELQMLSDSLVSASSEFERSNILRDEIQKRNIELPYELGNSESTKTWLKAKFNSKK